MELLFWGNYLFWHQAAWHEKEKLTERESVKGSPKLAPILMALFDDLQASDEVVQPRALALLALHNTHNVSG